MLSFELHKVLAGVGASWMVCAVFARFQGSGAWSSLCKVTVCSSLSFYPVLPNFVSFAEHGQLIITAENSALQSGFHGELTHR